MRVLVTWASKRGGTEEIARIVAECLASDDVETVLRPAGAAGDIAAFDAVVVGGALYANRWHRAARRFVRRNEAELRRVPVWLFSSGPLDDSADRQLIGPTREVSILMERVGALGHATFGGRLSPDARGFPARAMAKKHSGDWRNPDRIRRWATDVARQLPSAQPGVAISQPARSLRRLFAHAVVGWALCGAVMAAGLALSTERIAIAVHAVAAPILFAAVAWHYFGARGAHEPLPTAVAFVGTVIALDLGIVGGLVERSLEMFGSFTGVWLPIGLSFLTTWAIGVVVSMTPESAGAPGRAGAAAASASRASLH